MNNRAELEVAVLLPGVRDARDACVSRLVRAIQSTPGIELVHQHAEQMEHAGRLCVHFDPRVVDVDQVRRVARQAGAQIDARYGHLLLQGEATYPRRARMLGERLAELEGVIEARMSAEGIMRLEYDREVTSAGDLRRRVADVVGVVQAISHGDQSGEELSHAHHAEQEEHKHQHGQSKEHEHAHDGLLNGWGELAFAIACGFLLGVGFLLSFVEAVPFAVVMACYLLAYFFGGFFTTREAIQSILRGRFEIDFLMLVAAAGAASLGEWAEGAFLLFLFSLGHALEHYAMGRARRAIEALADLTPDTALVRRDGQVSEIALSELVVGDTVVVRPNERLPADGFVIKGETSIDQSPITGESVPVDKTPVDDAEAAAASPEQIGAPHRVFAGTINQSGAIEAYVTKTAGESTLARVVEMVSEAQTRQSPTQQFTDKFERYFVPAVMTMVIVLCLAWLVLDESVGASFYRAMAVLVAASPCALAISTPSAVLSGVARAARGGVLVKGGAPLEALGTLKAIAFDKTGTLTEGKPRLANVSPAEGVDESELLGIAVAVERLSDHPLAAAVARDGLERLSPSSPPEAHDLDSITGRGVKATVEGQQVYIGKDDLFAEIDGPPLTDALRAEVERLECEGRTTMIVLQGDRYLGILGLMDTPREAARATVAKLREQGIERMIMISGDNQQVASSVAKEVGIDEAWGDLMPDDKVDAIQRLRAQQGVAMVGDGVNDAPAMASATVGIAMGAAGSDVALETADVALMADDLSHLPFAIGLSRRTHRIIRQNLWISLGMVAILVPSTLLGLRLGAAVVFHEGSTLMVVGNALRLLAYRGDD